MNLRGGSLDKNVLPPTNMIFFTFSSRHWPGLPLQARLSLFPNSSALNHPSLPSSSFRSLMPPPPPLPLPGGGDHGGFPRDFELLRPIRRRRTQIGKVDGRSESRVDGESSASGSLHAEKGRIVRRQIRGRILVQVRAPSKSRKIRSICIFSHIHATL